MVTTQRHRWGGRRIQSSALTALLPIAAIVPVTALALAVVWWPAHFVWHIAYWQFALIYLAAVVIPLGVIYLGYYHFLFLLTFFYLGLSTMVFLLAKPANPMAAAGGGGH